ncbi:MAG: MmgE/PrpD family protein [Deltaproteobacteria bacterium]|nr:MmgE/PrpD family protein [Deltaproteobacteria bacterium]
MIGSGTLTKQIAGYLARTGFDALDAEALRATKEHILYTLGTILAGSSAPGITPALAGAKALSGPSQESTVLVTGEKLPAASAALVNATMGHSRELDINDDRIAYKSSVTVVPAALATAEKVGNVSGRDFIAAVCLGVDLGIRLGLATNPKPIHARAIALGPFAATSACGKILGLDEMGMHNALGIAFCRSTVAGNSTVAPSLSKRLGVGFASQSGVVSALLASAGFPAAGEVFQGAAGFFQTFYRQEGDYDALADQLGRRFEIVLVGPKPFPSCRYTHCAVTGVLELLRKHGVKASDIQEVRVQIGERDMRSVGGWSEEEKKKKRRPEGVVDAQFSIPYTVAATLLSGGLSLEDFTDARLRSEEVLNLAARVKPILNPELDRGPMDVKPQVVEIYTRDGKVLSERVVYPKGNPNNPVTFAELVAAFRGMASYAAKPLSADKIDDAVSLALRLEEIDNVAVLAKLLTA